MIIFDYGHTLCYEAGFDGVAGAEAVLKYAVKNKNNLSAAEISAFSERLYEGIAQKSRDAGVEVHNQIMENFAYEYLQLEFSLDPVQRERIFWENAAPGIAMPNIEKALDYLNASGIRSGVISNISFGGKNLADRLDKLLPQNQFEFVIASSEYMYRKPDRMIFDLALRKADLRADEVWHCGDNTKMDAAGAYGAGIFPVWFHSEIDCDYRDKSLDARPSFEHLYIRDWPELIAVLKSLDAP
jgi:putative hydrolase of the HAD superfamily